MKPVRYSRHARNRLRLWDLDPDFVEDVIGRPDAATPSVKGRRNAWKRIEGRWVRVTFIHEGAEVVVVAVTVRRQWTEGA